MKLYLMQHAKPLPKEQDPAQPLAPEGIRDVDAMGALLARVGIQPEVIFHSPKDRAKQTAQGLAAKLPHRSRLEERADLKPLADPGQIQNEVAADYNEIMLVGHLPHLARLATRLLTNGTREEPYVVSFRQGAVLCLVQEDGTWQVAWMITPELLS